MANSSVKAKVEALIGEIGANDTTIVSEWASDTAREVINILPEDMLWSVSTELNDSAGGSGATVTISLTSGVITSATITAGGSGYLDDPVITISGGTGIGGSVRGFSNGSAIIAVDVLTGGSGYDGSETVAVSSSNGVDVSTSKFLYAHKNGYEAIEITPSMKGRASDIGSIYRATDSNPVYFREAGKVTILPTGGKVAVVSFPTILYDHADVTGVPDDVKHLVIMGTAVKGRLNQLNDLRVAIKDISNPDYVIPTMVLDARPNIDDLVIEANVPSLALSTAPEIIALDIQATPPTAPAAPTFSYTDVSDNVAVSPHLISPPSSPVDYVTPALKSEPVLEIGTAPVITWDMPAPPTTPIISEKVVADFSDSYPTYTPPTMNTPDWEDTNTWISTEEDNEMLAARVMEIQAKVSEYSARLQESQAAFNKENSIFQAIVQEKIQEAQLSDGTVAKTIQIYQNDVQKYIAQVNALIQNNKAQLDTWQIEWNTKLQKYQADIGVRIQQYTAEIQNNLNIFNSSNLEYNSTVQFAIENAKMRQQSIITELQTEHDARKQNSLQKMQKEIQEYTNKLNKYGTDIQDYQARVSTEIQEWTINNLQHSLAKWNTERTTEIQKYSTDLEKYKAESQNEQQVYAINEIQKEIQLYSSEQANRLGKFQSDIQNSTQQFQSEFGVYAKKTDNEFQKHQTMMQELQLLQQQYQQGLQMFIASYTTPKGVEENVK